MKHDELGFPDLEAAFEAVKGMVFGPLDAGYVKFKFNEIVREKKLERELETNPLSVLAHGREDREGRERRDRDHQNLTLTALLATNAAYRAAHEAALVAFAEAGNAIDDAIEAGEKALADVSDKIEDYLASTPRLKDGRYVMFDAKDGCYKDENFQAINEEDLAGIDREAVKPILPYERMIEWKKEVGRDLDELRGYSVEIGDRKNRALDQENPTQQKQLEIDRVRAEDLKERAQETQEKFENWAKEPSVEVAAPEVVVAGPVVKPGL